MKETNITTLGKDVQLKKCRACGEDKELQEFPFVSSTTGERRAQCVDCIRKSKSNINTKQCTKCKEEKPINEFHYMRKETGERMAQCKSCRNERYTKK